MNFIITLLLTIMLEIASILQILRGHNIFGIILFLEVLFYIFITIPVAKRNDDYKKNKKELSKRYIESLTTTKISSPCPHCGNSISEIYGYMEPNIVYKCDNCGKLWLS